MLFFFLLFIVPLFPISLSYLPFLVSFPYTLPSGADGLFLGNISIPPNPLSGCLTVGVIDVLYIIGSRVRVSHLHIMG